MRLQFCLPLALLFLTIGVPSNAQNAATETVVSVAAGAPLTVVCTLRVEQRAVWRLDGGDVPADLRPAGESPAADGRLAARLQAAAARPHHAGLYTCSRQRDGPRVRVVVAPAPPAPAPAAPAPPAPAGTTRSVRAERVGSERARRRRRRGGARVRRQGAAAAQLHRAGIRRLHLQVDQERHGAERGAGAGRPVPALQAARERLRVQDRARARGRLRELLVQRPRVARARPPRRADAARLERRRGAEDQDPVQGDRQAVPARHVDLQELVGRGRRHRAGVRRPVPAGGERGGRAGRRAGAAGGAALRRGRVLVHAGRRHRLRDHAARQGHVRRAVALPGHLRRGVRAVRHHPRVREAPHQARAGRLRHRQPRPEEVVSATRGAGTSAVYARRMRRTFVSVCC